MAYFFDGIRFLRRDVAILPNPPFTMAAWTRPTIAGSASKTILSLSRDHTTPLGRIHRESNQFRTQYRNDANASVVTNAAAGFREFVLNVWQPVFAEFKTLDGTNTRDAANTVQVNSTIGGQSGASGFGSNTIVTYSITTIGMLARPTGQLGWTGGLAEVAIWEGLLSSQNRDNFLLNKYAPSIISPSTLVGYWPLIDNYEDASGNGFHMTFDKISGTDTELAGEAHPSGIIYSLTDDSVFRRLALHNLRLQGIC